MALVFRGERFLSVPEAAERLSLTRLTVHRWVRQKRRTPRGIKLNNAIHHTRTHQTYLPEALVEKLRGALRGTPSLGRKRSRRGVRGA